MNLKQLAIDYDGFFYSLFGPNIQVNKYYYKENYNLFNEYYELITKSLVFVGSGSCCQVFTRSINDKYVIKFFVPWCNEKILLNCNPTISLYKKCLKNKLNGKNYSDCEDSNFYDYLAIKHFLFYNFISKNGLSAIQRKASPNKDVQKVFLEKYKKTFSHNKNVGYYRKRPVVFDAH